MAYRTDINTRDSGGAIAAVVAIHAALLFALLNLSGKIDLAKSAAALSVFDFASRCRRRRRHRPRSGRKPKAQARRLGAEEHQERGDAGRRAQAADRHAAGAADRREPTPRGRALHRPRARRTCAGPAPARAGLGNGTGSGSGGNGSGGGGDDGVAEPPHLATPVLSGRDFPRELLDQWPRGATVFLRLRVDPRGYVAECIVDRGTGVPAIDCEMCNLAHERLRFRPALNRSGQAVAGWFGYAQPAPR